MHSFRYILLIGLVLSLQQAAQAQSFQLFDTVMKREYPSVVYDFLERYLYETDSLAKSGEPILQRLKDDKVMVLQGDISDVRKITPQTPFLLQSSSDRFYQTTWQDTSGNVILEIAFPMQYELLLGKPKVQIEKEMKQTLLASGGYKPLLLTNDSLSLTKDSVWSTTPARHYYVESLNTAKYYRQIDSVTFVPIFDSADLWHSAANLFQGVIDSIDQYKLYIEQNMYGFQKEKYLVSLQQWLAYCQSMKLDLYFGIEEEREDGLQALLIAHSSDLGFNHMLSVIIPDNFVGKRNRVIKATMNAYIPTQNIKDLYQQYVKRPKKKI